MVKIIKGRKWIIFTSRKYGRVEIPLRKGRDRFYYLPFINERGDEFFAISEASAEAMAKKILNNAGYAAKIIYLSEQGKIKIERFEAPVNEPEPVPEDVVETNPHKAAKNKALERINEITEAMAERRRRVKESREEYEEQIIFEILGITFVYFARALKKRRSRRQTNIDDLELLACYGSVGKDSRQHQFSNKEDCGENIKTVLTRWLYGNRLSSPEIDFLEWEIETNSLVRLKTGEGKRL